ncbi:PREDICTED: glucosamine 6-phosphate N-acetyltransferase-like [Priapulus caudatus]|uniref:Glucosamine 6-phosphate N-acetyltransferase n=1 Tax=Priapulus caudatus TaxID=37621 RepID=A0ABM1EUS9_PRICU|nr:PREDICTED: glucosamine 6-phosphate N-acetyltransferase-like [Priapulus caudatus]
MTSCEIRESFAIDVGTIPNPNLFMTGLMINGFRYRSLIKTIEEEEPLFDGAILRKLDFSSTNAKFNPKISPEHPGENLIMRPLCPADYARGFVELLRQLTKVGDVSQEDFIARYKSMKACPDTYYLVVIVDVNVDRVVGAATMAIENKFIHRCATRGRIEDVVVCNEMRGKQLGKLLVETMLKLSEYIGCYKTTLDCKDAMIPFYQQLGLHPEPGNNFMVKRFHE